MGTGLAMAQDIDDAALGVEPQALPATPKVLAKPPAGTTNMSVDAVLTSKGFLAVWDSSKGAVGTNAIQARSFSNTGAALKPLAILKSAGFLPGKPRIAPLGGDKFAVIWKNFIDIEGGVFDLATNKFGGFKSLGITNHSAGGVNHEIVKLANGRVAIVVMETKGLATQVIQIYTFDNKLKKLSGPVAMNGAGFTSFGTSLDFTVVDAQTGGFAIWRDRSTPASANLYMRKFTEKGVAAGGAIKVNSTPLPNGLALDVAMFGVSAVKLTNNRILVTWTSLETVSGKASYDIRGRLFSPTGSPIGADFRVNTDRVETQYYPEPVALPAGKFTIGWVSNVFSTLTRKHLIRSYTAAGAPRGNPVTTHTIPPVPTDSNIDTSMVRLSDGSLVNVFHEGPGQAVVADGIAASLADE